MLLLRGNSLFCSSTLGVLPPDNPIVSWEVHDGLEVNDGFAEHGGYRRLHDDTHGTINRTPSS